MPATVTRELSLSSIGRLHGSEGDRDPLGVGVYSRTDKDFVEAGLDLGGRVGSKRRETIICKGRDRERTKSDVFLEQEPHLEGTTTNCCP